MNNNPTKTQIAGPTGSTLADMISVEPDSTSLAFSTATWIKILVLAGLFMAFNSWQIEYLLRKWQVDSNWSHGFLIPLFSLYLLYSHRHELLSAQRRPCIWGLVLMILSIVLIPLARLTIGTDWVCNMLMVMSLFGLVWYMGGSQVMRVAWLPVLYLILAMPLPPRLYQAIALPLQNLAASVSTMVLQICGVDISVSSSSLKMVSITGQEHSVQVAEACSGVRSLMAFIALSIAMAYVDNKPMWQRIVLVLAGVPIAIICNLLRVTLTGTMFVLDRPELGQKFMHEFMGMMLLVPALLLLLLLGRIMHSLYVEDEDQDDQDDHSQQSNLQKEVQT